MSEAVFVHAVLGDATTREGDPWPEFMIGLRFYVGSTNPRVIEEHRQHVWQLVTQWAATVNLNDDP